MKTLRNALNLCRIHYIFLILFLTYYLSFVSTDTVEGWFNFNLTNHAIILLSDDQGVAEHGYHFEPPLDHYPPHNPYPPQHHYPHPHHHYGHDTALKALLLPLAGVALLGAAAVFASNPILLQLGVVSGRRRRRELLREGPAADRLQDVLMLEKFVSQVSADGFRWVHDQSRLQQEYCSEHIWESQGQVTRSHCNLVKVFNAARFSETSACAESLARHL